MEGSEMNSTKPDIVPILQPREDAQNQCSTARASMGFLNAGSGGHDKSRHVLQRRRTDSEDDLLQRFHDGFFMFTVGKWRNTRGRGLRIVTGRHYRTSTGSVKDVEYRGGLSPRTGSRSYLWYGTEDAERREKLMRSRVSNSP